ncbi:hypothetical protein EGR_10607 [Echinococcus granulosus]|uniref:Uncharacterized protein n=1 Tax=Echinococcus granulosus TaxID=6210 RepID=W6UM21_ECHGR|nr:hypothetical protein EGR_10607 [Echinococcus granulosus]EUB54539.1 hypothetical protein EGR_10607 [Echinococcus granulosus]
MPLLSATSSTASCPLLSLIATHLSIPSSRPWYTALSDHFHFFCIIVVFP